MSYSKKYYLGVGVTSGHLTEQLTQEELLPKNYYVQTFNNLQSLQNCIDIIENENTFCGAIVSIDDVCFPLSEKFEQHHFHDDSIWVLLVEK